MANLATEIVNLLASDESYDRLLLNQMEILEAKPEFLRCNFRADKAWNTNVYKSIHGGIYSGLVDLLGGIVIATANFEEQKLHLETKGSLIKEVSTDINISYINAAKLNDVLYCEAKLLKKGKNLAFTQVDIYKEDSKELLATGRHTKFILKAKL